MNFDDLKGYQKPVEAILEEESNANNTRPNETGQFDNSVDSRPEKKSPPTNHYMNESLRDSKPVHYSQMMDA